MENEKSQKQIQKLPSQEEQNVIIEEKISKVNGDIAIKRYQKGKLLGKGGFAKCFEVTNLETKKRLAAKIIPKSQLVKSRSRQKLISEIKIHKSLHHTTVVQFEHVFEDSENVYILLELCPNQTLNELIKRRKRLHEIEVQCYIQQIINGLKYLHVNRVIHRDLKLGNLFLGEKMDIKLGDFGLATKLEFDGEKKRTICGTPNYIAPEILDGKTGHSYEVDIWSLGVILYTLLIGKPPYETPDVKATYKKIRMNQYSFPDTVQINEHGKQLIIKILQLDPAKRPSLDEIQDHPFMNPPGQIPKFLPLSTLACPPNATYIKQYQQAQKANTQMVGTQSQQQFFNNSNRIETIQPKGMQTQNLEGGFVNKQLTSQAAFGSQSNFNTLKTDKQGNWMNTQGKQGMSSQNNEHALTSTALQRMSTENQNEVWVKQWVDYSSKYGLGYLLSNGCAGVFFNDSTKMIMNPTESVVEYIERKTNDKQDTVQTMNLFEYPKEIQKKITLIQHFRNYLDAEKVPPNGDMQQEEKNMVYVKKWMKTRHAIMFRLSNRIVQVNFTDKTEILLSSESKIVTYVNKKMERSHYPLATALENNNLEMAKRLKYTKEILTHMLQANNNKAKVEQIEMPE